MNRQSVRKEVSKRDKNLNIASSVNISAWVTADENWQKEQGG